MKKNNIFSTIIAILFIVICFSSCSNKDEKFEYVLEQANNIFPGCEYKEMTTGEYGDVYIFNTFNGIPFRIYDNTTYIMGKEYRTLSSTYCSSILSYHEEQILNMSTENVNIDIMYGDIVQVYLDGVQYIGEAAQICIDIEQLCQFEVSDQDRDVILEGIPAIDCPSALFVFYFVDTETEEYIKISTAWPIALNNDTRSSCEELISWLEDEYGNQIN